MGEFVELIEEIRKDKNQFYKLINKFEPLIKKYSKLLFKDDEEDTRAEFLLALWEAVKEMEYYRSDAKIVKYLSDALKWRFYELYRKSRKQHDKENDEMLEEDNKRLIYIEEEYHNVAFQKDIMDFINTYSGTKKKIFVLIMKENMSDAEIASTLNLSRQYIHRLRRRLYEELKHRMLDV